MTLALALKAGIPLIRVQTPDTVHLPDYIQHLTGSPPLGYKNGQKEIRSESVHMYTETSPLVSTEETYKRMYQAGSSLIINRQEHPLFYDTGPVVLSEVYLNLLLNEIIPPETIPDLVPVFRGCTQKEIQDILLLTETRDGDLTIAGVNITRQEMTQPPQGLEPVNTDLIGYYPDPRIKDFVVSQKKFFSGEYDPRLRPRGLLATGPSGTGKTGAARYIAKNWGVPLFRLSAGVQDRFVGGSEQNLSAALKQVESMNGCVLLIDEVEKFFSGTNDSGVTQQLLGSLLWWMQEHTAKVFTYMTCNSVSIPTELYRPGRIDHVIEFKGLNALNDSYLYCAKSIINSYQLTKETAQAVLRGVKGAVHEIRPDGFSQADLNEIIKNRIQQEMK